MKITITKEDRVERSKGGACKGILPAIFPACHLQPTNIRHHIPPLLKSLSSSYSCCIISHAIAKLLSLSSRVCVCVFRWWFLHVEKHDHFCFLSLNLWCVIWHCMWKKWPLLILLISVFVVTWNCKIPCTSQTPNWRGVSVHRQIVYSQEYLWLNFIMPLLFYF